MRTRLCSFRMALTPACCGAQRVPFCTRMILWRSPHFVKIARKTPVNQRQRAVYTRCTRICLLLPFGACWPRRAAYPLLILKRGWRVKDARCPRVRTPLALKFRGSLFFNTSLCIARDWRTGLDAINETVEAELPHGVRTARSLFFYDWYRSNRFDPLIGGLPEFNALHYAPVRTWLQTIARGSGGVGEHVPARPVPSAMPVSGGAHGQRGTSYAAGMVSALREGGGPFVVLQWRSELVKEGAFGACTAAMVNVTTRITDRLGNRSAFVDDKGGGNCGRSGLLAKLSDQSSPIPLILVTDLSSNWSLSASAAEAVARGATGGNASHQEHQYQPSCSVSRSYKNDMHSRRSMALDALLRIPGVLRYSVPASPETHVFVAGGPPLAVDVGVLAIREYILAVAANVYLTCWRRHPPQGASPPSALCSRCMWFSEFITRVGRHRAEAGIGQCTETDLWKSSAVSLL